VIANMSCKIKWFQQALSLSGQQ